MRRCIDVLRVRLKKRLVLIGFVSLMLIYFFCIVDITATLCNCLSILSTHLRCTKSEVKSNDVLAEQLWFMNNRSINRKKLWSNSNRDEDRFVLQLQYLPDGFKEASIKQILAYDGLEAWEHRTGRSPFIGCPVDRCSITMDKKESSKVDAIIFKDKSLPPEQYKPHRQVWILRMFESPLNTEPIPEKFKNVFNWTATYRRDSDVINSYGKWIYYDESIRQFPNPIRNFAFGKNKQVAWFVSNCHAHNNRFEYALELQKYIDVDIFGYCGSKSCPRSSMKSCYELLDQQYKFYLSFENSNCIHYITEKLFSNGLSHNILPIVMGARKEDYIKTTPHNSIIHVDDFPNPKELAKYLHKLDKDDKLYNEYFKWKGTGEFIINNYFFCRLCTMLHDNYPNKWYPDINEWWRGQGVCITSQAK